MLNKKKIESIVNNHLEGTDKFLVGIDVSSTNVVDVFVDGDHGISIGECVKISRLIESSLDRDQEDFELRVSSPGLDKPFKLLRQYRKYIGKNIRIDLKEGKPMKVKLLEVDEEGIHIERSAGKKGKEVITEKISFRDLKSAKPEISFK